MENWHCLLYFFYWTVDEFRKRHDHKGRVNILISSFQFPPMFWDYRYVLWTTCHAMNFQNNFQILAQVVGQSPIPRYGYQAVWEVKRVKHLTRCVALHRTIHRAKLAKLETFVSSVPQLAQLLSCSSCCWAWWSLAVVAWTSVEESLWTHHAFFLLREGDRLWQQTVVSFIITRILHRSERINNSKLLHIISNKTLLQQKQWYGFKGPLVWAPANFFAEADMSLERIPCSSWGWSPLTEDNVGKVWILVEVLGCCMGYDYMNMMEHILHLFKYTYTH